MDLKYFWYFLDRMVISFLGIIGFTRLVGFEQINRVLGRVQGRVTRFNDLLTDLVEFVKNLVTLVQGGYEKLKTDLKKGPARPENQNNREDLLLNSFTFFILSLNSLDSLFTTLPFLALEFL